MKLQRTGLVAGLVAGALALSACGSDNESDTGGGGASSPSGNAAGINCAEGQLSAAGSSAQRGAYTAWIDAYQQACSGAAINYDAQGSGNGRTQFIQKQVPLAGSDSALKEEQKAEADARCAPGKAIDLPTVLTPIAMVYNLQGVEDLALSPEVAGQIFNGKIKTWNDPAIAKLNPDAQLPATSITPVFRSSDSGTTDNFTSFLSEQAATAWPYEAGQAWPVKGVGQGGPTSAAVVQNVKGTDGAIGYVDNPDAVKNDLNTVAVDTGNGPVKISEESVGKAINAAELKEDGGDLVLSIDYGLKEAGAYPAILATYQITCTQGLPAEQANLVKSFLQYQVSDAGQKTLGEAGYTPLPAELRAKVKASIDGITTA